MKIHILYPFKDGPWGGANQFLHALRKFFSEKKSYSKNAYQADIILFNLNPNSLVLLLSQIKQIKQKYAKKLLIVRIDGPVVLVRGKDLILDKCFFDFTKCFSDGVVYQSHWSKKNCFNLGMKKEYFDTVIINAPDPTIFNQSGRKPWSAGQKIRLIATSWSANWNKGFDVYQWLDENLDFSRYEMTFIGNSPIKFRNIHHIPPLPSRDLAKELKKNHIFITASKNDPCSNSLIEALHCGLPVMARNDGGHPEIVGGGGELFDRAEDIPHLIEKIVKEYERYQSRINLPSMEEVGKAYYDFMYSIYNAVEKGEYVPKRFMLLGYFRVLFNLWLWKGHDRLIGLQNRMKGKR